MTRGMYCVAFGDPARDCVGMMITSFRKHLPKVPIALASTTPLGPEDVFIEMPDSDIGGRRAKLRAYEVTPPEWDAVLYLDADIRVISRDIEFYFKLVEAGWEMAICKDVEKHDTLHAFRRPYNLVEWEETVKELFTLHTLQLNGGAWSFRRGERVSAFFQAWGREWERHAQKDQGALVRALYRHPLRMCVLGNEWNYFPRYNRNGAAAALLHYPGDARRWDGIIPGRIDSPQAWDHVKRFGQKRGLRGR